jgi:hypothetical protein
MTKRFEAEPRAMKPAEFDEWVGDLAEIADTEGVWMLVMAWMYAPPDCCMYLTRMTGMLEGLILRARYTDQKRAARSGMSSMSIRRE